MAGWLFYDVCIHITVHCWLANTTAATWDLLWKQKNMTNTRSANYPLSLSVFLRAICLWPVKGGIQAQSFAN